VPDTTTPVRSQPAPRKRPRHLMDPDNLRREVVRPTGTGAMNLEPVQKWVLSVLAFTTIIHLSVGIVIASLYLGDPTVSAQVGLNVIAAAFGVISVAVFRGIHQRRFLSPWLLIGLVPGVVGIVLVLR